SIGTFVINGDFTNNAGGTVDIELSDPVYPNDVLAITGTATLAGTLNTSLGTIGAIEENDAWDIISSGGLVGAFGTINYITIPTEWVIDYGTITANTVNIQYTGTASLPIQLVSFTGKRVEEAIELDWRTASELNNDYM